MLINRSLRYFDCIMIETLYLGNEGSLVLNAYSMQIRNATFLVTNCTLTICLNHVGNSSSCSLSH